MILQDLHTHSKFDDGRGSLMAVAKSAEKLGLTSVGFSGHSPLPYENDWSMTEESLRVYIKKGKAVKAKMRGRVDVLLGIEYDIISDIDLKDFDYVIGSVHHVKCGEEIISDDESIELTEKIIDHFGSADKAAEAYFDVVGSFAENDRVDIIGHFDLITKFNERKKLFDTESETYVAAAKIAMEKLVKAGKIFEINTGAMSRGYRTEPYPSKALLKELNAMGGKITITSDSHSPENLGYGFEQAKELALECGFTEVWQLIDGTFKPVKIK